MTVVVIMFATWLTFPRGQHFCVDRTHVLVQHTACPKNLGAALSTGKVVGVRMYDIALRKPSRDGVIEAKNDFRRKMSD